MAKYTVELREIITSGFDIFDFEYSLYTPEKKSDFESKFKNRFWFREIGQETPERFRHFLKTKVLEIAPVYSQLFRAYDREIDAFKNKKISGITIDEKHQNALTTIDHNSTNIDIHKYSDTPQGRLDFYGSNAEYITELNFSESQDNGDSTSSNDLNITQNTDNSLMGYDGITEIELLDKLVTKIHNIDEKMLNEFNDLFMQIY